MSWRDKDGVPAVSRHDRLADLQLTGSSGTIGVRDGIPFIEPDPPSRGRAERDVAELLAALKAIVGKHGRCADLGLLPSATCADCLAEALIARIEAR